MKTTVLAPCTPEDEAMLAERRRLGQDRLDEVWQGEYHMVPGPHSRHGILDEQFADAVRHPAHAAALTATTTFNLGDPEDYRVPDRGYHRGRPDGLYLATAALVVEVLSPGDETYAKFSFFADHGVDEVAVVDGDARMIHWFALRSGRYEAVVRSEVLGTEVATIAGTMDW